MPNSTNSQVRATERVSDMWNQKGSWLLLAGVAISMFMAGCGMQAWLYSNTITTLQASFDSAESEYRARIRELNQELKELIPQVKTAAEKASEAVDVAKTTQQEAIQNGKDNSEASRP